MVYFILSRIGVFFTNEVSQTVAETALADGQDTSGTISGWYLGILIGGAALLLFMIVCIVVNAKKPPQQFKKNHRDMPSD